MTYYFTSTNVTVSDSNKWPRAENTNLDTTRKIHRSHQMQESGRNHHTSQKEDMTMYLTIHLQLKTQPLQLPTDLLDLPTM